jgi:hypothetical protein
MSCAFHQCYEGDETSEYKIVWNVARMDWMKTA